MNRATNEDPFKFVIGCRTRIKKQVNAKHVSAPQTSPFHLLSNQLVAPKGKKVKIPPIAEYQLSVAQLLRISKEAHIRGIRRGP